MQEHVISVTAAARRFADCVNRVRYQGVSFVLQKNGIPVARIVPVDSSSGTHLEQLAVALREARKEALFIEEAAFEEEAVAPPDEKAELPKSSQPPSPTRRPLLNW
jgi:prevent-host-death family protein